MNIIQRTTLALLLLMSGCCLHAQNSKEATTAIYGFAYSTNLSDSTSYVSAISVLPEASVNPKTHFLNNRDGFAKQFKTYVEAHYKPLQTSVLFFSKSRKTVENQFVKLRSTMQKRKGFKLVELNAQDFAFTPVKEED